MNWPAPPGGARAPTQESLGLLPPLPPSPPPPPPPPAPNLEMVSLYVFNYREIPLSLARSLLH